MSKIDRRKFLFGAGGVALALPFLESWPRGARRVHAASSSAEGPRRIIVMAYPMGLVTEHWIPRADFSLPEITAPLELIKNKCVFVSEMANEIHRTSQDFVYGHQCKKESALTGTLSVAAFGATNNNHVDEVNSGAENLSGSPANSESIENYVGRAIRSGHPRAAVNLGVHSRSNGTQQSSFFFEGRATPVTMEHNPKVAFDDLFAGVTPGEPTPEALALQARRQSVLDAVQDNFAHVRSRVSRADQERLDAHAAHIRDLELATQAPPVSCSPPTGFEQSGSFEELYGENPSQSLLAPLQVRNLVHSMACGLAPVGRIEFLEGHNPYFGIPTVDDAKQDEYGWHAMVHGSVNPTTGMTAREPGHGPGYYAPELLAGYRFYVQQFADLITQLDALPDGDDQSMLDTSLVILASDMGNGGGHAAFDTGYILAGNTRGGALGQHISCDDGNYNSSLYNVNHLLTSVANIFGVEENGQAVSEFGLRGFAQGGIPGLCG